MQQYEDLVDTGEILRVPHLHLVPDPPGLYERRLKRCFDAVVGSAALVVALPLLAAIALVLRVTLGKDVIFHQTRVGRDGQDFGMMKFRTMRPSRRLSDPAGYNGPERRQTHKAATDPRHTKVGRFLRKTSLDELPQLVHVVRGEMSLVGPRPELSTVIDRFGLREHDRHRVRPGLTGTWQVTRRADHVPLHQCFDDDLAYLDQISLRTDLAIIAKTVGVIVRGTGS